MKIRNILVSGIVASVIGATGLAVAGNSVSASDPGQEIIKGVNGAGGNGGSGDQDFGGQVQTVVNILLFLLGTVAVVMIIIGGIRYAASNGDQTQVTAAKNTILYSVIGLIVAILAFAIVNFLVDTFSTGGGNGNGGGGQGQN